MKQAEVEHLRDAATRCFEAHGWALPPNPYWDITDFGLGDWRSYGLVLVNLAEEPEYCEKLMYAQRGMTTPKHFHKLKKEDIICRQGSLLVKLWEVRKIKVNREWREAKAYQEVELRAGERITLEPGTWHEFTPTSEECIIGEVSTANDDQNDNFFERQDIGRFPTID